MTMTRYEALAVYRTPQEDVVRSLKDLYRTRGYDQPDHRGVLPSDELIAFEVSPTRTRWCLAFPDATSRHAEDAEALSRSTATSVLLLQTEVGATLSVKLYQDGRLVAAHAEGSPPATEILGLAGQGGEQVASILAAPTDWRSYYLFGDAMGLEGLRDYEAMLDAEMDQEEAGYRRVVLRRARGLGIMTRIKLLFAKPDLSPRG